LVAHLKHFEHFHIQPITVDFSNSIIDSRILDYFRFFFAISNPNFQAFSGCSPLKTSQYAFFHHLKIMRRLKSATPDKEKVFFFQFDH
jgi:hypothetical protein